MHGFLLRTNAERNRLGGPSRIPRLSRGDPEGGGGLSVLGGVLLMVAVSLLIFPHGSLSKRKADIITLKDTQQQTKQSCGRRRWGSVQPGPSSLTFLPFYDGLDVTVTSNIAQPLQGFMSNL